MPSPLIMSVNNRTNLEGVPQWQPDEQVSRCPLCLAQFTLFFRRHHCRRCGRVVCGNCSSVKTTYLPSSYVVCPPSQIFLETPHIPHRTCDECVDELQMIRAALRAQAPSPSRRSRSSSRSSANRGIDARRNSNRSVSSQRLNPYRIISSSAHATTGLSNSAMGAAAGSSSSAARHASFEDEIITHANLSSSITSSLSPIKRSSLALKQSFEPIVESRAVGTDEDFSEFESDSNSRAEDDEEDETKFFSPEAPPSPSSLPPKSEGSSSSPDQDKLLPQPTSPSSTSSSARKDKRKHKGRSKTKPSQPLQDEESSRCPVCNRRFDVSLTESDREKHITECLKAAEFSGSPEQTHRANRMIVYKLPEKEAKGLDECVICFEEFHRNDSVGRLECLCVYHEKCILDWFARKGAGECPVHAVNS